MSEPSLYTLAERPDLIEHLHLVKDSWPEFMLHGNVVRELWRDLRARTLDLQWVLYDEDAKEVVGLGNTTPLFWDGDTAHLPSGFDAVLLAGVRQHADGIPPNAISALQAVVAEPRRGQGLSGLLIHAMRTVAGAHGFETSSPPYGRRGKSGTR